MYSERLLQHFHHPTFVGDLASPEGFGIEGDPTCGDVVHIAIQIKDGAIRNARFRTLGCVVAIAASDAVCDLVVGRSPAAAEVLNVEDVVAALGGIPDERESCVAAPVGALRAALRNARSAVR